MEVRPAQQLSREAPQELYRAALAANDAHRSLALMAAAAELRHPLACDKMKAQSDRTIYQHTGAARCAHSNECSVALHLHDVAVP